MNFKPLIYAAFVMRFVISPGCADQRTTNGCSDLHNEPNTALITVALGSGFSQDSVRVQFRSATIFDSLATTDSTGYAKIMSGVGAEYPEYNYLSVLIRPDSVLFDQQVYVDYGINAIIIGYIRSQRRIELKLSNGLPHPNS